MMNDVQVTGSDLLYPKVWIGYVCGILTFLISFALLYLKLDVNSAFTALTGFLTLAMFVFLITGVVYWFMSVYRFHKILSAVTNDLYPISAGKAAGYQLIPFFNLYWMFRWPAEISDFLQHIKGEKVIPKYQPGVMMLLASFLGRFIVGFSIVINFLVLDYICRKTKEALQTASLPVENYGKEKYKASGPMIGLWIFIFIFFIGMLSAVAIPNFVKARSEAAQKAQTASTTQTLIPPAK